LGSGRARQRRANDFKIPDSSARRRESQFQFAAALTNLGSRLRGNDVLSRPAPVRIVGQTVLGSALFLVFSVAGAQQAPAAYALHYDKPASTWTEALPVGNGRLGAMVFGAVNDELLQLNEATLWSGGPVSPNVNPEAFASLAPARQALAAGDYAGAAKILKKMQGQYSEGYLPLADPRRRGHHDLYRERRALQARGIRVGAGRGDRGPPLRRQARAAVARHRREQPAAFYEHHRGRRHRHARQGARAC
jgi:hypothetical protein